MLCVSAAGSSCQNKNGRFRPTRRANLTDLQPRGGDRLPPLPAVAPMSLSTVHFTVRSSLIRIVFSAGTHKQVQGLNRAAVAREKDRKAKEEADRKAAQLAEQNDRLQKEKDDADARAIVARRERDEAREQRSPPSFRGGDQIYPSLAFSPFAYQPSYVGGGGGWGGGGGGGGGGRNLRWYPGGQFIPGGGRSPAGGGFF